MHSLPEPFPYQHDDAVWLCSRTRGALLHQPGLGKTLIASLALYYKAKNENKKQSVLVLGPKTLKYVWDEHISQIKQAVSHYEYHNYDKLIKEKFTKDLAQTKWDVIICDESHLCMMRWSAKRCKNFFRYFVLNQPTQTIWCLTATPGNKSALDYHPLFCLCEPAQHGKEKEFGLKYCQQKFNPWSRTYDYSGFKCIDELKDIFRRIARRRTKKTVLPQLPKKMYQSIPIDIDTKTLSLALEINENEVINCIKSGKQIPAHIASLIAAIGLAKVKPAVDWITDSGFSTDTPIVVFAWTKQVVHAIQEGLHENGVPACAITGETAQSVRQTYIQDFQNGKYAAIVLNMAAGGVGVTLTKASHLLFAELPWSPAHYIQAQDRVHRITQTSVVNVYNMIAVGTVDKTILAVLKNKMLSLENVLRGVE